MSGTSLDGLDMAFCEFTFHEGNWKFDILESKSVTYPSDFQKVLQNAIQLPAAELLTLNNSYGTWLGEHCKLFIDDHKLKVDLIASHGHTVHHQPKKGFTYQIGSGQHLANAARHKVVCDFRIGDVCLGGQGAPLVPIGDQLLFSDYDFCLNLGGISNISYDSDGQRIAYDVGMANMPLNYIAQKAGKTYDKHGKMARGGTLIPALLKKLNALRYYATKPPKSTGYEWFTTKVIPLLEATDATPKDLLHTLVQHNAHQIAKAVRKVTQMPASLLVSGGGAKNGFFMEVLRKKLDESIEIVIPSDQLIDYKEALVFAFMGVLRMREETNCLSSVTGASTDSSGGVIFLPQ